MNTGYETRKNTMLEGKGIEEESCRVHESSSRIWGLWKGTGRSGGRGEEEGENQHKQFA